MTTASDILLLVALVCMLACQQAGSFQAIGQGMLAAMSASFHSSAATHVGAPNVLSGCLCSTLGAVQRGAA